MTKKFLQPETTNEEVLLKAGVKPYVSIILPTFNESRNVAELLKQINSALHEVEYEYECIFVDDSSDNTSHIILNEAKKYPEKIGIIKRSGALAKTGLTQAFRRGFREAQGKIIVCMDTDLQHPPETIKTLVDTVAKRDVDIAVASRYTFGGSAGGLNGFFRRLVSKVTTYYVWILLPSTRKTTDPMTGFFAFNKSLLERVKFSSLGFKVLVELLAGLHNPKVIDIPFTFRKRKDEVSKATLKQGFLAYRDILSLFMSGRRGSSFLKLLLVTGSASLLFGLISTYFTIAETPEAVAQMKPLFEIALILLISISTLPIFNWAIHSFNYHKLSLTNTGITLLFTVLTFVVFSTLSNFHVTSQISADILSFYLFVAYMLVYFLFKPFWHKEFSRALSFERWFALFAILFLANTFAYFVDYSVWWNGVLLTLYTLTIAQGVFALYLMIYIWDNPKEEKIDKSLDTFASPQYSFTAIVPCKHEKHTIADTIRAMHAVAYPNDKKQVIVVIHKDSDDGTIDIVEDTIKEIGAKNIQLVTYNETPVNKPHGLNKALEQSTGDFVAIFDAEDEPHPGLFNVVNTSLLETNADVVQSGVQLMNFDSNWYSTFNVLEYYFWFKSSLHFYAKNNVTPLGGVSVFFRRRLLEQVGGWDMSCLTEDAEVGIRLSQAGAKMSVIYDSKFATREETPPSLMGFVKQRTRWAQGFLQILSKGMFLHFPTLKQKFLALYILSWPLITPFVFLLLPFGVVLMLTVSLTPALAVLSNVSLLLFSSFIITLCVGFYEFTREYQLKFSFTRILIIIFLFYPYTLLLALASLRAIYRNLLQINVWEKTEHLNTHRKTTNSATETLQAQSPIIKQT
jgi:cellulose synthase/poly-beta-1,6-N-acetylglucosamine synthase-like glycosyltransferase